MVLPVTSSNIHGIVFDVQDRCHFSKFAHDGSHKSSGFLLILSIDIDDVCTGLLAPDETPLD